MALAFRLDERTKRLLDIIAATMGLILFAPILLITSIAIKLDSRGPIFVREIKYGYKNRTFQVLKFRFATAGAGSDLTRVGRFLNQTGIDELPQFFNLLRGEVSIVGRKSIPRWQVSMH